MSIMIGLSPNALAGESASPLREIVLKGHYYDSHIEVLVNDNKVKTYPSATGEIAIRVPANQTKLKIDVSATRSFGFGRLTKALGLTSDNDPVITASPASVCSTQQFYNAAGKLTQGTRDCTLPDLSNLKAENIKTGVTIYTVTGNLDLSQAASASIRTGVSIAGVMGSANLENHSDCSRDGELGCVTTAAFAAVQTAGLGAKIIAGNSVAGVTGAIIPEAHSSCTGDNQTGCLATAALRSADTTAFSATDLRSGKVAAGVSGNIGQPSPNDVRLGIGYGAASTEFLGTITVPVIANVASGVGYGAASSEFTGTAAIEAHLNCVGDNQTGCVATATYKSANTGGFTAGDVRSGKTIAGVAGNLQLPTIANVRLASSFGAAGTEFTGNLALPVITNVRSGSGYGASGSEFTGSFAVPLIANVTSGTNYGAAGTEFTGTAVVESHTNCTADNLSGCVATATYKSANTASFAAGDVKSGKTIAGVAGNLQLPAITNVRSSISYGAAGTEFTGNLALPALTNVRSAISYGASATEFTGSMALPAATNVASGVGYGNGGTEYTGSAVVESHINCTADNQTSCVATATYLSANTSSFTAGDVRSGKTIAGVAGNLALPSISNVRTAISYGAAGSEYTGNVTLPLASNVRTAVGYGASFSEFTGTVTVPVVANVASGVGYGSGGTEYSGVAAIESHSNCTGDAQSSCVATGTYKSADTASYAAGDVRSGKTIAGVSGNLQVPLASTVRSGISYGAGNTEFTGTFAMPAITNVRSGVNFGAALEYTGSMTLPAAGNVASGILYGGLGNEYTGSAIIESHGNCTGANQTGCLATSTYKTLDLSNLGAGGAVGLSAAGFNTRLTSAGVFEYWDATGARQTGTGDANVTGTNIRTTITILGVAGNEIPTPSNCASAGAQGCVAAGSYYAATACAAGGSNNCFLATAGSYSAADLTNLAAGNVRRGVNIAGTTGNFPSATTPLPRYADSGATTTTTGSSLSDLTNFTTQLTTNGTFQFWDSTGAWHSGSGDSDLNSANLIGGVELENFSMSGAGISGPNCSADGQVGCYTSATYKSANTSAYTSWDIRKGKSAGGIAGSIEFFKGWADLTKFDRAPIGTLDFYDTIDDCGSQYCNSLAPLSPWGQSAIGSSWTTVTPGATYRDEITKLEWTITYSATLWQTALNNCAALNIGGHGSWRLPTVKELVQANIDGIWAIIGNPDPDPGGPNTRNARMWSSTTLSYDTTQAWDLWFGSMTVHPDTKATVDAIYSCVSP